MGFLSPIACVAWQFWLLRNKGGRGQRNHEEIGAGASVFIFLAAAPLVLARISRLRRSCARLDKTAMLRRLFPRGQNKLSVITGFP